AVSHTVKSAFGFQGQKCSAASRAIVLAHNYDAFVERLVEATRSLTLAPARVPHSKVGPVIDETSQQRILQTIARAKKDLKTAISRDGELPGTGYWVPPTVFTEVPADHDI